MTYTVRPAQRGNAKPLIGIHAQSGAGKTYSALVLARGCVGPTGKIVMIETEEGRGESYADPNEYPEIGGYQVVSMRNNFSPRNYGEAIEAANATKPDALIIDSASHEWMGVGGVLDMADKNGQEGKKGLLQWQRPKMDHTTYFMLKFMQSPVPLVILCMRSKYPMVEVWNEKKGKKEPVRSDVLEPVQSEDILSEMFLHGWIDKDHNFHIGKITNKGLAEVFLEGKPINGGTGARLAAWMAGRRDPSAATAGTPAPTQATTPPAGESGPPALLDAAGAIVGTFERFSAWLTGLEDLIAKSATADQAQAIWEHNEDTFMRGQSGAKSDAAIKAFARVGKAALDKRMPPAQEDEQL